MHEWHDIRLTTGEQSGPAGGFSLMEAVALYVGEPHGDWPVCVCPVLAAFGRIAGEAMPDHLRTDLLLPLVPMLVDTRDPQSDSFGITSTALERRRAAALVTWCVGALPSERVIENSDEAQGRTSALDEAAQHLAFGNAPFAALAAAAAVAWTAQSISRCELVDAAGSATRRAQAAWESAIDAYRVASLLG